MGKSVISMTSSVGETAQKESLNLCSCATCMREDIVYVQFHMLSGL